MKKVLQKLWKRVLTVLVLLGMGLSSLIPKNRRLLVFGSWFGKRYDDNSRYLFEWAIANRPDLRCIWITNDHKVEKLLRSKNLPVCMRGSLKAFFLVLRAKYILVSVGRDDIGLKACMGGARLINLWHGTPIKKIGYDAVQRSSRFWELAENAERRLSPIYVLSSSSGITELYKRCFGLDGAHILELGQARCDLFSSPHENPLRQLYPGKKIILYMPTFRQHGAQKTAMETILDFAGLDAFCRENGMVFLIKQHHYVAGTLNLAFENIAELTDTSLSSQEMLDAADILVTDYSSCFTDHLLLNRPQVFFAYDLDTYKAESREIYYDYESFVPGRICHNYAELIGEIVGLSKGKDAFSAKRQVALDYFCSAENRKNVCKKQLETILTL